MTSQYGAYAFHAGSARLRASTRMHTRASAHTLTEIRNIYCFSTATMIRERALLLRYTYIVCLVRNYRRS